MSVCALGERRYRRHTCSPYEKGTLISSAVEVGHEAVDNVRLRGKKVDSIGLRLGLAPVLDTLDIGDVGVKDIVLFDYIVNEFAAVFVDNQDLPLQGG